MEKDIPRQYQRNTGTIHLLKFPSTKNILWDHAISGDTQTLHISSFRKPKLDMDEDVLRFAQQHIVNSGQKSCAYVLAGSLKIDEDGEGVIFGVERLEAVVGTDTSAICAARELHIPFIVQNGSKDSGSTLEEYSNAVQLLWQRCCAKEPVDLCKFLIVKGWCGFYPIGEKCAHHLTFELVTLGIEIQATPIMPVPIVTTALSKNLSGPMSLSHMQGTPKTGYLTMDHTRKLLLVLENDPKVSSLPLVGIWVSGVSHVYSPYIWACCLRFLHNSSIKDRVCSPPDPFLLVLYNPTYSKPEFYDCCTSSGTSSVIFDCYTGYKTVQIGKGSDGTSDIIEIEMNSLNTGTKYELFQTAVQECAGQKQDVMKHSVSSEPVCSDDITPRLKPVPYKSCLPMVQSLVPEVSLFFGDLDTTYVPNVQHPKDLRSQMKQVTIPVSKQTISSGIYNSDGSVAQPGANSVQCHAANAAIPANQGHPRRPSYFSCPSCPKLAQFSEQPHFYDHMHEPLASTRRSCPNFSTSHPRLVGSYPSSDTGCRSDESAPNTPTCHHPIDDSHPYRQPFPVSLAANAAQTIGSSSGTMPNCLLASGQAWPVTSTQNCMPTCSTVVPSSANQLSEPMTSNKLLEPWGSGGLPILKEEPVLSRTPQSADGTLDSDGTKARRSDASTGNSIRPSGSGLRFAHEKPKLPYLPGQRNTQTVASASVNATSSSASEHWKNVPAEIYQLILKQDEQLKQMKAQIAALTARQSLSLNTTTDISNNGNIKGMEKSDKQVAAVTEMCSTATNTSVFFLEGQDQVSPRIQPSSQILQDSLQKVSRRYHGKVHHESKRDASNSRCSSTGNGCDAETPLEIRHRGKLPLNSTHQGVAGIDISQAGVLKWVKNVHDNTVDSIPSQIIVDQPSFQCSLSRDTQSQESYNGSVAFNRSPESPVSVSRSEQEHFSHDLECKDEQQIDNKTTGMNYKCLDTLKRLLPQNPTVATPARSGCHGNMSSHPSTTVRLNQENMHLEEQQQSYFRFDKSNIRRAANTMRSTAGTMGSADQLLIGHNHAAKNPALLQKMFKAEDSSPNVTTFGMPANDLTFATRNYIESHGLSNPIITTIGMSDDELTFTTRNYLERHGLLDNNNSANSDRDVSLHDCYKFKTDCSTITAECNKRASVLSQEGVNTLAIRKICPVAPISSRESTRSYIHDNDCNRTPYNDSRQSVCSDNHNNDGNRTPYDDSRQSVRRDGTTFTDTPSEIDSLGRCTPNSRNNFILQPINSPPYSPDVSPLPRNCSCRDQNCRANARFIRPQKDFQQGCPYIWRENERYVRSPVFMADQMIIPEEQNSSNGVPNYHTNFQHCEQKIEVERILDIEYLRKLPKLM